MRASSVTTGVGWGGERVIKEERQQYIYTLTCGFFQGPVEAVLQRMAGTGGRSVGGQRRRRRRGRRGGGGPAAAAAEARATRAERVAEALVAEMAGLAQVRRDVMRSRRQGRLDDALVVS